MSGAFTLDLEKIEAVAKDLVPDSGPEVPTSTVPVMVRLAYFATNCPLATGRTTQGELAPFR